MGRMFGTLGICLISAAIFLNIASCSFDNEGRRAAAHAAAPDDSKQPGGPKAGDADAKNAIFASEEWRQTRTAFDDWLSVQKLYSDEQVREIKSRLRKQIATNSAAELQQLHDQMRAKLDILLSPEAGDARYWLGYFASPDVVFSREELAQFDIVTMTPAQLDAALRSIQAKRAARSAQRGAFNANRDQQVARTLDANRRRQATQRPTGVGASSAPGSALAPRRRPPPAPKPRPPIIIGI